MAKGHFAYLVMVRNPIHAAMLLRTLVVACLLSLSGLVAAQGGAGGGIQTPAVTATTRIVTLSPSFPVDSLSIGIGSSNTPDRIEIRADTTDLPEQADWPVLTIGNLELTLSRSSSEWGESTFSASLDSGKTGALFFEEDQVLVSGVFDPATQMMEIFVNDCSLGVVSYAEQKSVTVDGLITGPVEVTTIPLVQSDSVPPSLPAANGSGGLALILQARFSKGPALIRDGGLLVSRQQVLDKIIARLGDRARDNSIQKAVFLDWETGDDDFDGTQAEAKKGAHAGPKKTWGAAKQCLKDGGILIINGNNGIYTDDAAYENLPANVTIVTMGDMLIGSKKSIAELFASGRWQMSDAGPVRVQ